MRTQPVGWMSALSGALVAEVVLVAATVAWVALYSHVIAPGQAFAVYQRHASIAGPWVSIAVGIPVFYALARWWARHVATALAMIVVYLAVDFTLLLALADGALPSWIVATSYATKVAATLAGAWHTRHTSAAVAA